MSSSIVASEVRCNTLAQLLVDELSGLLATREVHRAVPRVTPPPSTWFAGFFRSLPDHARVHESLEVAHGAALARTIELLHQFREEACQKRGLVVSESWPMPPIAEPEDNEDLLAALPAEAREAARSVDPAFITAARKLYSREIAAFNTSPYADAVAVVVGVPREYPVASVARWAIDSLASYVTPSSARARAPPAPAPRGGAGVMGMATGLTSAQIAMGAVAIGTAILDRTRPRPTAGGVRRRPSARPVAPGRAKRANKHLSAHGTRTSRRRR